MATDPFTQVYDKIRDTLTNHSGFAALCNAANLADYSGSDPDPGKRTRQTADYPAWELIQTGGGANPRGTSTSTAITLEMELRVLTGDRRVDQQLYPIMWQALRALHTLKDGSAMGLSDFKTTGVRLAEYDVDVATERADQSGWVLAWIINIDVFLTSAYIEA